MRYVDTNGLTIPEAWQRRARKAAARVQEEVNAGRKDLTFPSLWSEHPLRDPLIAIVGQKCWYCETNVHSSNPDVDHYRPKKGPTTAGAHSGYWWLAYKPDNYRIACKYCNSGGGEFEDGTRPAAKVALFPLLNESDRATTASADLKLEKPVLLDPTDKDDHFLIDFSVDGWPHRRSTAPLSTLERTAGICRVEGSIEICRLDRDRLNEGRAGKMEEVAKAAKSIDAIADTVPTASDLLEQQLRIWIDQHSLYSGAALSALRAHRYLPLIEKIFATELAADLPEAPLGEIIPGIIDVAHLIRVGVISPGALLTGNGPTGEVTAELLPSGHIRYGARPYSSLDSAAKAATGTADTDGWTFWSTAYKGSLQQLSTLRNDQLSGNKLSTSSQQDTVNISVCKLSDTRDAATTAALEQVMALRKIVPAKADLADWAVRGCFSNSTDVPQGSRA